MIRRKRRKHPRSKRLGWFAFGVVVLVVVALFDRASQTHRTLVRPQVRQVLDRHPRRPAYPFSVIRGGIYSAAEMNAALRQDSIASAHYIGFHRERLYMTTATAPMLLYASYRIANSVYWTSHRVHIAAGEALVTDGTNLARARCGNRLSDSPQQPVTRMEPMERDMETPEPVDLAQPPVADSRVLDEILGLNPPPAPRSALAFEIFPPASLRPTTAFSGVSRNDPTQGAGVTTVPPSETLRGSLVTPGSSSPTFHGVDIIAPSSLGESRQPNTPGHAPVTGTFQSTIPPETVQPITEVTPPIWPGIITAEEEFPGYNGAGNDPGVTTTSASGSPPATGPPPFLEPEPNGRPELSNPSANAVPEPAAGALVCVGAALLCIAAKRLRRAS